MYIVILRQISIPDFLLGGAISLLIIAGVYCIKLLIQKIKTKN
jgi:hypothetical protein